MSWRVSPFDAYAIWWVHWSMNELPWSGGEPPEWEGDVHPPGEVADVLHRLSQGPWYVDHGASWGDDREGAFYERLELAMLKVRERHPDWYEAQKKHLLTLQALRRNGVAITRPRTEKVREMTVPRQVASDDKLPRGAREEWPFEVKLLPLDRLLVDDTYQRPPHKKFIADNVEAFDETLVGTIDVSERRNGYAILDGQQRYLMMQQVRKAACYCSVYTGMSVPEEAAFFY